MQLSTRFAAGLLVLAGAAAGLRLALLEGSRGADRCAAPGALKATSLIPGTLALGERLEALGPETFQWSEGEVENPALAKLPMRFQIVRSYAATALYVNPLHYAARPDSPQSRAETAAAERRLQPEELRVRVIAAAGVSLPIHVAWDHTDAPVGPSRLAAWLFVFDNQPVRSPLRSQLANALSLAAAGARPLTIVTVSALAPVNATAQVEDAAVAWLADAWRYTARVCTPR
jgi:hypothetical protein